MKRALLLFVAAACASLGAIMCTGEEPARVDEVPQNDGGNNGDVQNGDGGGVPQSLPKGISGLALWLDAADANSVERKSGTETVAKWRDKSGTSHDFTPVPGEAAPTFAYNALNKTMTAVSFSQHAHQYLKGPSLLGLPAGEAFVVFQSLPIGAAGGGPRVTYGLWQFGYYLGAHPTGEGDDAIVESFASAGQPFRTQFIKGKDLWEPQIFGAISSLEGFFAYHNGVQLLGGYTEHDQLPVFNEHGSLIGANAAYQADAAVPPLTPTNWFNGFIAEVIIYDHRLPKEQHDAVNKYLSEKWGIALKDAGP